MGYITVFATTLSYRSIPLKLFSVKCFNCHGIIEMLPSTIMSTARHTGKLYYTIEQNTIKVFNINSILKVNVTTYLYTYSPIHLRDTTLVVQFIRGTTSLVLSAQHTVWTFIHSFLDHVTSVPTIQVPPKIDWKHRGRLQYMPRWQDLGGTYSVVSCKLLTATNTNVASPLSAVMD